MATLKIKKGDTVKVIAGKDKDKEGKVIAVDPKNNKVTVEGINVVKKHEKPSVANQNGGIVEQEAFIDASNVMYVHKGKPVRIGFRIYGEKKVRFDRKTGDIVPEEAFFADGYREPVAALLQAHLPEALEGDEEALAAVSDPGLVVPNGLYEVTKDGVTWYYQPYVIAPFSVGVISISIPWNELKPYVR